MADTFTTNLNLTKPEVGVATDWAESINTDLDTLDGQLPLSIFNATSAPTATSDTNAGYAVGSRWVDTTNNKYYVCVDATATAAIWQEVIPAADIGTTVQAYDANIVSDASYVHTDNNYTTTEKNKLAGIESGATADQTGAEIKAAYEAEADTNAYTDAEKSKLAGIESGATADQSAAEIKTAYESNADTNAFTDAEQTKLAGIEAGAEVNVATNLGNSASGTALTVTSSTGTNTNLPAATTTTWGVMTDEDKTKLDGIATGATANTGTVTSVAMTVPTGLSVSGSPVTTSGTLGVTYSSGYQGYTTTEASKLSGIEAGADVTDATNVAAAGAVMDGDFTTNGFMKRTGAGTYSVDTNTYLTGNQTITLSGDVSGSGTTSISVTVADDSHNHVISNVDGLQTALDGKSSTSHNHTIDSLSNTTITSNTAGEILKWNGSAWVNNTLAEAGIQPAGSYLTGNQTITLSGDVSGSGTTSISVTVADDSHNHIISNVDGLQTALDAKLASSSYTASDVLSKLLTVDGSGSNLDADLLDGVQGSSYLRSDTNDTFTGDLTISGDVKATTYQETYASYTPTGTTQTVNTATGNVFTLDLGSASGNVTLTFSNPPTSGTAYGMTLKVIQASTARTITWPTSVDWPAATAPTLTATNDGVDVFVFYTHDGGTTWHGFTAGQALA